MEADEEVVAVEKAQRTADAEHRSDRGKSALTRLESELGDVVFCSLLSVALATRDYGVSPDRV